VKFYLTEGPLVKHNENMLNESGRITLKRADNGWTAHFTGQAAETVRFAFGTNVLPTAFSVEAPAANVKREIQAKWPHCIVTVQEGC